MPAPDPDTRAHLEWLGFIQPNGLVVSAPALVKAGAILNRQDAEGQALLAGCIEERTLSPAGESEPCLRNFRDFASAVLGWGFARTARQLETRGPTAGTELRRRSRWTAAEPTVPEGLWARIDGRQDCCTGPYRLGDLSAMGEIPGNGSPRRGACSRRCGSATRTTGRTFDPLGFEASTGQPGA